MEQGVETVTVEEDGRLKSKTVNGVDVPIEDDDEPSDDAQQQQQQATSEL